MIYEAVGKQQVQPTSKQVDNSSRHNPKHTKTNKNVIPQNRSHITVRKEMIHRFPISLAQATSVHKHVGVFWGLLKYLPVIRIRL
jgi:hypothetical protein